MIEEAATVDMKQLSPRAAIALLSLQLRSALQDATEAEAAADAIDVDAALWQLRSRLTPLIEDRRRALEAEVAIERELAAERIAEAHVEAERIIAEGHLESDAVDSDDEDLEALKVDTVVDGWARSGVDGDDAAVPPADAETVVLHDVDPVGVDDVTEVDDAVEVDEPVDVVATTIPSRTADVAAGNPIEIVETRGRGDKAFFGGIGLSGFLVLSLMAAVGVFLAYEGLAALQVAGFSFVTTSTWQPDATTGGFGIAAIMPFTFLIATIAVVIAAPIALGTALFITEVAPVWLRSWLIAAVDLMAAVPSVVYGLWGLFLLQGQVIGLSRWLNTWLGWFPLFSVSGADPNSPLSSASVYTASSFIAGIVVAMMVMPIQCSVMREVFSQVPVGEREGAFALGSTRWGMISVVALPFGRGGMIGGTMLGLGRALGETIAVLLIISPRFDFTFHALEAGSNSVSALIAIKYSEASDFGLSALMAAGLALFAITLTVNFVASYFIARSRSGAGSEA